MLLELKFEIEDMLNYPTEMSERKDLAEVINFIEIYEKNWRGNYYQGYTEVHILCVADMIRERRLAMGLSKAKLSEGICDERTLGRIEKGNKKMQKRVRKALLERLGLSTQKFDGGIVTNDYGDYKKYAEMMRKFYNREYDEAEEIYNDILQRADMEYVTNRQFKEYWGIILRYESGQITKAMRNEELWRLLDEILPVQGQKPGFYCKLTEYEQEILATLI